MNSAKLTQAIQYFIWIWLTLLMAFYLSWIALSQQNFLYGIWHDYAGISENIEKFAPQNKFRDGFETTNAETRKALFAGIVVAIHNKGDGLEALKYLNSDTQQSTPLLHATEVLHLKDVANLIEFLEKLGWGLLLLWSIITSYLLMMRKGFPSMQSAVWNLSAGLLGLACILLYFGPKTVFYQLHIWVFPPEHPWFFYYQDSLMSTMMKAPDLFAYIAISLSLLALLFFSTLFVLFSRKKQ